MNVADLDPRKLLQLVTAHRQEVTTQLRSQVLLASLAPALEDAHDHDASATEFDAFDTIPSVGAGQITATVGGADLVLYATIPSQSEAGVIVIQRGDPWAITASTGAAQGWGIVNVSWSLNAASNFSADYNAGPSSGYAPADIFACDLARLKVYKPLSGRTISAGGQITCRLTVRPLGLAGSTVVWRGGTVTTISSAACTLIQKMNVMGNTNFGPLWVRAMFQGCNTPCQAGGNGKLGRKSLLMNLLGDGKIGQMIAGIGGMIGGQT